MSRERIRDRLAGLIPWIFALTIVLAVVIGFKTPAPFVLPAFQEDQVLRVLRAREADIRAQIEKNLSETSSILKKVAEEMEKKEYNAQMLLAAVKEKRRELHALREELHNVLVQIETISYRKRL